MPTKTELIAQVNQEFPRDWPKIVEMNPRSRLPNWTTFTTLVTLDTGEVSHEYGTEVEINARFQKASEEPYELRGMFFQNHHDSGVHFTSNPGAFPGTQEEAILSHLFGNIFYGNGGPTGPELWKSLAD